MAIDSRLHHCLTNSDIEENFNRILALIDAGPAIYTVTFNSDGGSEVAAQKVVKGMPCEEPTDPTKEDYTFLGWFKGTASTAFNFSTPITGNITLKAKWEAAEEASI